MAYPPSYTRTVSFQEWQALHPGEPLPGTDVDGEFDDVSVALTATQANLALIQRADGELANGTVGPDQLEPGLFDHVADSVIAAAAVEADRAEAAATQAEGFKNAAQLSAQAAQAYADAVAGTASTAVQAANEAEASASVASSAEIVAQNASIAAANDASHAEAAATDAERFKEQAFKWAEYLAGPVEPAPPGWPEAVDDGMFSAKWWAVRAMGEFSAFAKFYLGAFNDPPTTMADGSPIIPGSIYYDLDTGRMMVWTGTGWSSFEAPMPAAMVSLAYTATAGQTVFNLSVASLSGATWVLTPGPDQEGIDVHVNGLKRLAEVTGPLGDYNVDHTANTVTLFVAAQAGDLVQIDVLAPSSLLAPGSILVKSVADLDIDWDGSVTGTPGQDGLIDGTRTVFQLREAIAGEPLIVVVNSAEIALFVDGVRQRPGIDYTALASTLTFMLAPAATSIVWALWYSPGGGGGLGGLTAIPGLSVLANPLALAAQPIAVTATADDQVFRRVGGVLDWGTVPGVALPANVARLDADPQVFTGANTFNGATTFGSTTSFAGVATFAQPIDLPDGSIPLADLVDGAACSILGRAANSAGVHASIAAPANDTILRRVGDALGFGLLTTAMFSAAVVPDTALSANVAMRNAANVFTATPQTISTASNPELAIVATAGNVDETRWGLIAVPAQDTLGVYAINDARTVFTAALLFTRVGAAISAISLTATAIALTGAVTLNGVATTDFARLSQNQTFTGVNTFQQSRPIIFRELAATADNGRWDFLMSSESFSIRALNDADTVGTIFFRTERTGTVVDSVALTATIIGLTSVTLNISGTTNFSALATQFSNAGGPLLRLIDPDAPSGQRNMRIRNNNAQFIIAAEDDAATQTSVLLVGTVTAGVWSALTIGATAATAISILGDFVTDLTVNKNSASYYLYDPGQALDAKRWRLANTGGSFQLQTRTDANLAGATPLSIVRTGTVVDAITFVATAINTVGVLATAAASATISGFRLPHGVAPSAPVNGDLWTTTTGMFLRLNGATVNVFPQAGGGDVTLDGGTF